MQPSWKIGVEQLVLPASLSYFHRNWPSLAATLTISLLMIWTYCFTPPASVRVGGCGELLAVLAAQGVAGAAGHGRGGVAAAEVGRLPDEFRPVLGPLLEQPGLGRDAGAVGPAPAGPVGGGGRDLGGEGGERDAQHEPALAGHRFSPDNGVPGAGASRGSPYDAVGGAGTVAAGVHHLAAHHTPLLALVRLRSSWSSCASVPPA